jgi:hypothetical protein
MSLYYRIAKPDDLRDLADQMAAWIASDNPKRLDWSEQPSPPAHDAFTQHAPEWGDGEWIVRDLTPDELAAAARKTWPNAAAFLGEFTMPELAAIELSTDPTIAALRLLLASWTADVWSDDPRIVMGLDALESAGIITEARRGEIVAK